MRKLFTILLTIAIVAVVTGLTEANTVIKTKANTKTYLVHDFTQFKFLPVIISVEKSSVRILSIDPSYGWEGCQCYHVLLGGTASFPYKVPAADCINSGHPKPTNCK